MVLMSMPEQLDSVRSQIARACELVGRDPSDVTLIAVSKTATVDQIREAYDLGLRDFGENRLQESISKIEVLPSDITWHFIGKLQSNKAKVAARNFKVIHSIESEKQLNQIAKIEKSVDALVQVNVGEEEQKSGVLLDRVDEVVEKVLQCSNVQFRGLMTIGPLVSDPEQSRPIFRRLAKLGQEVGAEWLSMGMSADFGVAIQEGSTHVRVGTAIFGPRG